MRLLGKALTFDDVLLVPACLLYTSDAADDLLCVDLCRRRSMQKTIETQYH